MRKGLMDFLEQVHNDGDFKSIHLTTNATLTEPFIDRFPMAGIRNVNISLDTLDLDRFIEITRRDQLAAVTRSIDAM